MPPGGGGMPQGMMPGAGAKKQGNKKAPAKRDLKEAEVVDPDKLPDDFRVPQLPPEALTTSEECAEDPFVLEKPTDKKEVVKRQMIAKYKAIYLKGEFANDTDNEKKLVADIIRYKLCELTRKENREKAWDLRLQILRDIAQSPSKGGKRDVRKFMLKTVVEEAPKLFQYHAVARLNAAILLSELADPLYNEEEAEGKKPAEPCVRALEPLKKMVEDGKQLTAVRTWGVNGLARLAALRELKQAKRFEIVDTLVKQLNTSGKEHEWYQMRLAEGLGKVNVISNEEKRPIVPQALGQVLTDTDRPWLVRAEAAQSIGRLPYDGDIDVGVLAYETARLAQQMTEAYNEKPNLAAWKLCFIKVYGAYKPLDDDDAKEKRGLLMQVDAKPALTKYKKVVQEAFDLVLPLVSKAVNDSEGIDAALSNLKKWLEGNAPKSMKIHPAESPINSKPIAGGKAPANPPPPADG